MLPDRKLNRLPDFDYRTPTLYFITSCVLNHDSWFGEVINGEMRLNSFGKIADEQFKWLQEQYSYIQLHTHIVMPNHVHAIIEIIPADNDLSAVHAQNLPATKIKSISELMGAYKTTTTKKIRLAGLSEFAWQRSFHDHIIRDARGYQNIYNYIENNPASWKQDKFYAP